MTNASWRPLIVTASITTMSPSDAFTSVTTDPSVVPLRELAYLPAGEMDPHNVPADRPRAGQLPSQVLETLTRPSPLPE